MLKYLPLSRALFYLLCLGIFPVSAVTFLFFSQQSELDALSQQIEQLHDQALIQEKKQALNLAVCHHFREADRFYIDKYVETLVCLESEIERLQKISQDPNFADDDRIKKRLELLTTSANALTFSEGAVHTFPLFRETTETLLHPIEVDTGDIQKILSRIEGVCMGGYQPGPSRPQLLITEFKVDKKKVTEKNEVYLLNLRLIKREFS